MYKILSIDAWAEAEGGWTWNQWYNVGEIETIPNTTRKILKLLRDEGYLSDHSKGRVYIYDDQYNLVICDRSNGQPVFAIEYGNQV